jgi:hypothetical protein
MARITAPRAQLCIWLLELHFSVGVPANNPLCARSHCSDPQSIPSAKVFPPRDSSDVTVVRQSGRRQKPIVDAGRRIKGPGQPLKWKAGCCGMKQFTSDGRPRRMSGEPIETARAKQRILGVLARPRDKGPQRFFTARVQGRDAMLTVVMHEASHVKLFNRGTKYVSATQEAKVTSQLQSGVSC